MFNSKIPTLNELPTTAQLIKSTCIAIGGAMVLLVTVVMPSEYAIDPTGAGQLLGLTQMGEVKIQLAAEAAADAQPTAPQAPAAPASIAVAATDEPEAEVTARVEPQALATPAPVEATTASGKQHQMSITLKPSEGAEVKLEMKEGARVEYAWSVEGGVVNYDTHGDPYNAPRGFYHGYGKGRATPQDQGTLEAAFDGKHGWFWRNRTDKPVTVTLRTQGNYISIKRVI
ncbi:transmembrane anchor protein [Pseudomonas aeruginosa]|uniref:transmembrane anchor protein n=1 Tax=Pseudomonas aeruginosa TaxID=287 RepID=UPI0029543B83|nr:transmembrane anchor protein [Pseudomonas aeruginosa]MDV7876603.1 transmembrane anchor protein [Pseudomonas aeruginosa]